jgi:hypothetical protein
MDKLKEKFAEKALPLADEVKAMIKEHGDLVLGSYTLEQVYHGMKGMIGMVTETSKPESIQTLRPTTWPLHHWLLPMQLLEEWTLISKRNQSPKTKMEKTMTNMVINGG